MSRDGPLRKGPISGLMKKNGEWNCDWDAPQKFSKHQTSPLDQCVPLSCPSCSSLQLDEGLAGSLKAWDEAGASLETGTGSSVPQKDGVDKEKGGSSQDNALEILDEGEKTKEDISVLESPPESQIQMLNSYLWPSPGKAVVLDLQAMPSRVRDSWPQSRCGPAGWHFPVGTGLADMVHCPSWQSSALSYYPSMTDDAPFQVVWRVWEDLTETCPFDPDHGSSFEFTVMSYNILAQDLLEANRELYVHCPEEVLEWNLRVQNILQEIQMWDPDILCLQEVQEDHYTEQLWPVLSDIGYTCIYKCRTGMKTDGCLVCYRGDRFSQLSVSLLELRRVDCELLNRDNVAIVLLLRPSVPRRGGEEAAAPICVANTHLLFNPRRGDVKLAQLALVLAEVDRTVARCRAGGEECEVILCGDLNSVPNMSLYQFITTGQLLYHGLPAWMISGLEDLSYQTHPRRLFAPLWPGSLGLSHTCQFSRDIVPQLQTSERLRYSHDFLRQLRYCQAACERPCDLELIVGVTDNAPDLETKPQSSSFTKTISHGLNLQSAYSHHVVGSDQSGVTTLHSEVGATVDYIFYSAGGRGARGHAGGLTLIGRLALLSERNLWSVGGLPNAVFPSDHLSLLAKFRLDASRPRSWVHPLGRAQDVTNGHKRRTSAV
ncbi:protein angel homolog 1 isoform X2 [Denticeps clupeoides]|uniref:protein angel homolog 1 isoform X2 n=1 Tax=Denticeps clupeoides TaxID=299321 RepID=UPI0010A2CDFA|nr:protein angel homolog 1 isoform X2 [Denticeps clupeoides]